MNALPTFLPRHVVIISRSALGLDWFFLFTGWGVHSDVQYSRVRKR